ncbi:MAG: tRNA (5-methylaminomethyl-2-thiouridine)(34)-methyltransferase MnmD [Muribaculaceae bacterium]|nr:tRNA (5-methylaminomethyl-2-thiouridine)(34)-methyltransferase MnmD [Muribaculaceae bacterium]
MILIIEKTADGSPTLYREDLDEHYHSVKGALAESLHVYLETGWRKASELSRHVRVFEVGFGTGMNAAITATAALELKIQTEYYSVELYPLPKETTDLVAETLEGKYRESFEKVNESPWEESTGINQYFSLHKMEDDLLTMDTPKELDTVYFDAFAPEKQPEMWDEVIFRKLYSAMKPGGVLTTYCAKGRIRRMLQHAGFLTERLPGPPGGKREILRATKPTDAMNC